MTAAMGTPFGPGDARPWIAVPGPDDDKYSRGVLGFVTGSARYPGAAVLGVEAALRTGVGMVRYLGPGRPTRLSAPPKPGHRPLLTLGCGQGTSTPHPVGYLSAANGSTSDKMARRLG